MQNDEAADTIVAEGLVCLNDHEKWMLIDAIAELVAEGRLTDYGQLQQQKCASVERRSKVLEQFGHNFTNLKFECRGRARRFVARLRKGL